MKTILILFAVFSIFCFDTADAAEKTPYAFKYHMHQMVDNFSNASISATLKKYDVALIYLEKMLDSIDEVRKYIPEKNADGTRLDREAFSQRLNQLNNTILEMKVSVRRGEDPRQPTQDIFNVCVGCHTEVKLQYLFRLPGRRSLFAEYMHKLSEHLDMARIYISDERGTRKVEENLKLIDYYLSLLEEIFPEKGPSGVVLNKKNFDARLAEIKKLSDGMKSAEGRKEADLEKFRVSLNDFCVICHEPERIK